VHIKHIHETIEKLAQYACEEACKNKEAIDTKELGEVVEMVEKLAKAEYYARIAKAMEEADKEEEEEIKYIIKKMKEEGEDWGEDEARRFYRGQPRSKTSGRFMSRRDGRRSRGYEELMRYPMVPEMYDPMMDWDRDMDRNSMGRLYYTSGGQSSSGNSGSQSGRSGGNSSGGMSGNMGGNTRGYEEGFNDGNRKGYEEGYREGSRGNQRDSREGRSGRSRRGYVESKEAHKGNSEQDKTEKMRSLEEYMKDLSMDITELIGDMDNSEKTMLRSKLQTLATKVQ